MKALILAILFLLVALLAAPTPGAANTDDFKAVVKSIEQFYRVKHQGLPFLARAGIKTARTAARIAGGTKKQLAEAGSVRFVYFDDQEFSTSRRPDEFRTTLNNLLTPSWSPLIQVVAATDREQTYIFLREAGQKFKVLVVTIGAREGTVVQVDLSPKTLAALMQDPDGMGKAITDDAAATNDDQE